MNLSSRYVKWQKRRAIKGLRREMSYWCLPVDDLSDEAIVEGVVKFAEVSPSIGITCQEAAEAIIALVEAMPPEFWTMLQIPCGDGK